MEAGRYGQGGYPMMSSACEEKERPPLLRRLATAIAEMDLPVLAYKVWIRVKGLDFGIESTETLGLDTERALRTLIAVKEYSEVGMELDIFEPMPRPVFDQPRQVEGFLT
jgi:hypothetical protein